MQDDDQPAQGVGVVDVGERSAQGVGVVDDDSDSFCPFGKDDGGDRPDPPAFSDGDDGSPEYDPVAEHPHPAPVPAAASAHSPVLSARGAASESGAGLSGIDVSPKLAEAGIDRHTVSACDILIADVAETPSAGDFDQGFFRPWRC